MSYENMTWTPYRFVGCSHFTLRNQKVIFSALLIIYFSYLRYGVWQQYFDTHSLGFVLSHSHPIPVIRLQFPLFPTASFHSTGNHNSLYSTTNVQTIIYMEIGTTSKHNDHFEKFRAYLHFFSFLNVCLQHVCLTCIKTENWKRSDGNGNVIVKMLIQFPSHLFPFSSLPIPINIFPISHGNWKSHGTHRIPVIPISIHISS